jgi:hypothetical protein
MKSDHTEHAATSFSVDTMLFDRDARRMTVTLPDGKTVNAPTDRSHAIWQTNIEKALFHWGNWLLFLMPVSEGPSPVPTKRCDLPSQVVPAQWPGIR